ncbi:hypothetical protein M514_00073 [Trichuris suis]|uniref:Reverse transcriptase Ty1/copia-type domain-containing protein n=1 Tax=Trichuris suis TaxID=68888 RepID=A0A085NTZ1_9BILA|nr:hypothetical protein M513_00073 [Trichuris suis]KFD72937.1 hypothetical protein M514_00073 [Trichuris suis]
MQSQADQCPFMRKEEGGEATYVLVYVDDLLVAGSSEKLIRKLGEQLSVHFQVKDFGGLVHYLSIELATVSRPDITMAVGLLCRCVEAPTECETGSPVKRVRRYLPTTIDRKLHLSSGNRTELHRYVVAEWAGEKTDRNSTSGYIKIGRKCGGMVEPETVAVGIVFH